MCFLPHYCYAWRSAATLRLLSIFITSLATREPQNFTAIWKFSQGKSCRMHESNTILSFSSHISPAWNVWRVGKGLMCGIRLDALDFVLNSVKDWVPLAARRWGSLEETDAAIGNTRSFTYGGSRTHGATQGAWECSWRNTIARTNQRPQSVGSWRGSAAVMVGERTFSTYAPDL